MAWFHSECVFGYSYIGDESRLSEHELTSDNVGHQAFIGASFGLSCEKVLAYYVSHESSTLERGHRPVFLVPGFWRGSTMDPNALG